MQLITAILITFLSFGALPAFAHSGDVSTQTDESEAWQFMWEMEHYMMGEEEHERMEELMEAMAQGTLSEGEQQEMIEIMQDPESGPGAMTMMMRFGDTQTMPWGTGMWHHGAWYGNTVVFWLTTLLAWTLLVLAIAYFVKQMKK